MRLFIAIELPDDVLRALSDTIATLKRAGVNDGVRWVRPEGIHLTLKFLGATPEDRLPAIIDGMRRAAAEHTPFDLQPEGLGSFHGGRHMPHEFRGSREAYHYNIRVIWVGVAGELDALKSLAASVEREIAPLGFPTENRPFAAHLTLARVRDDADRETRERIFRAAEPYLSKATRTGNYRPDLEPGFPMFHVKQLSLMESTLRPGGATYRCVEAVDLRA